MATKTEGDKAEARTLESMVDAVGLRRVLLVLVEICDAKAEHVAANWQDGSLAKAWKMAAIRVELAANSAAVGKLP
jgi:hypothetical protein